MYMKARIRQNFLFHFRRYGGWYSCQLLNICTKGRNVLDIGHQMQPAKFVASLK
jgi:hypothetical protein